MSPPMPSLSHDRHVIVSGLSQMRATLAQVPRADAAGDGSVSVQLVQTGPGQLRIAICGVLSTAGAAALQGAMIEALMTKPSRIHMDLTGLTYASPVGIAALVTCLALARELEGGVGISVAGSAARHALLRFLADG